MVHGNKITEANKEEGITGDDAVFCEVKCNAWIHRVSIRLRKQSYEALSESESQYLCPHCMLSKQTEEIKDLSSWSYYWLRIFLQPKTKLALKANQAESSEQPGNATELFAGDTLETVANIEVTNRATPAVVANTAMPNSTSAQAD